MSRQRLVFCVLLLLAFLIPGVTLAGPTAPNTTSILAVSPVPLQCVLRTSPDPAARLLTLTGEGFSLTKHNLQFRNVVTGEYSIHFHNEVNWISSTQISVDMSRIAGLLWNDSRLALEVQLTTYEGGEYVAVSGWSPKFTLSNDAAECRRRRVLEIVFNPIIESAGGQTLIALQHWNDPFTLDTQYAADINQASHDVLEYEFVYRYVVDDIPAKRDGFDYTDESYLACLRNSSNCHRSDTVDYGKIFSDYDICDKVVHEAIAEVWLWGGPYFGYWEYNVRGPTLNIDPENIPLCGAKTLYVMGFSYERHNNEMVEDFGHQRAFCSERSPEAPGSRTRPTIGTSSRSWPAPSPPILMVIAGTCTTRPTASRTTIGATTAL